MELPAGLDVATLAAGPGGRRASPGAAGHGQPAAAAAASGSPPRLRYQVTPAKAGAAAEPARGEADDGLLPDVQEVAPLELARYGQYTFYRFDLAVPVLPAGQWLRYRVRQGGHGGDGDAAAAAAAAAGDNSPAAAADAAAHMHGGVEASGSGPHSGGGAGASGSGSEVFSVFIPGFDEGWRWAFTSCSGFSLDIPFEEQAQKWVRLTPC